MQHLACVASLADIGWRSPQNPLLVLLLAQLVVSCARLPQVPQGHLPLGTASDHHAGGGEAD